MVKVDDGIRITRSQVGATYKLRMVRNGGAYYHKRMCEHVRNGVWDPPSEDEQN